jgi:hypothetical protein
VKSMILNSCVSRRKFRLWTGLRVGVFLQSSGVVAVAAH